jgi:magnesium-transporting ATPase (P-type)
VKDVVPGDVVVIKPGVVHFDLAILKGNHIKVDESALSGETTPIIKEPMNPFRKDEIYCPLIHKANTIFAGTKVIDVCATKKELGLVLTIGSFTTKGELLCDVLSYERHRMAVDDEVSVVLFILFLQSVVLLVLVFYFLQRQWVYAWFYGRWK